VASNGGTEPAEIKPRHGVILSMKREGALEKLRGYAPDMALSYEITFEVSKPEVPVSSTASGEVTRGSRTMGVWVVLIYWRLSGG